MYADDFLAGTIMMSNEERGLFITLLCRQWTQGHVTIEEIRRLSTAMPEPSLRHVIAKFKEGRKGVFKNARLEKEREKQQAYRKNRSESGQSGAFSRWHSHGTAIPKGMAKNGSPSPSPSPASGNKGGEGEPPHVLKPHERISFERELKAINQELPGLGKLSDHEKNGKSFNRILELRGRQKFLRGTLGVVA